MILCLQIERLTPHLEAVAVLMDGYRRGESDVPERVLAWLEAAEKTMASLRLPEGSELSILRGSILKISDALHDAAESPSRSRVRSARNAAACLALERGEDILRRRLLTARDRLDAFQDKLSEGMTALALQAEIPERSGATGPWLNAVWAGLRELSATRPLALYLSAALSAADRLYILEGVLSRLKARPDMVSPIPHPEGCRTDGERSDGASAAA